MKKLILICLMLFGYVTHAQDNSRQIEINLTQSLYSLNSFSYSLNKSTSRFKHHSNFTPAIELGLKFNRTKIDHSVLLGTYRYNQSYSVEVPSLASTLGPNQSTTWYFNELKYFVASLAYRFSYNLNDKFSTTLKVAIENIIKQETLDDEYNVAYSISTPYLQQAFTAKKRYPLASRNNLFLSLGFNYKFNKKFEYMVSIDAVPKGNHFVHYEIEYSVNEPIDIKIFRSYVNISVGIKYLIGL